MPLKVSSRLNVVMTLSAAPGVEVIRRVSPTSSKRIGWLMITPYFSHFTIRSSVTSKISSR
ncbi:hypothetical protein ACVWWN_003281 [Mycobacterium sp. URHB0021]